MRLTCKRRSRSRTKKLGKEEASIDCTAATDHSDRYEVNERAMGTWRNVVGMKRTSEVKGVQTRVGSQ